MSIFSKRQYTIEGGIGIDAQAETVWQHITEVDIAAFQHPPLFSLLDIPKPLRAEITEPGLNGRRTAFFSNGQRFSQVITEWRPYEQYDFTFQATPGFRVAYLFNLHSGPFQMKAGSYRIIKQQDGIKLTLASLYELRGLVGFLIYLPVTIVMNLFQAYLLSGIKANAERQEQARSSQI